MSLGKVKLMSFDSISLAHSTSSENHGAWQNRINAYITARWLWNINGKKNYVSGEMRTTSVEKAVFEEIEVLKWKLGVSFLEGRSAGVPKAGFSSMG